MIQKISLTDLGYDLYPIELQPWIIEVYEENNILTHFLIITAKWIIIPGKKK